MLLVSLPAGTASAADAFTASKVQLAGEVGYGIFLGDDSDNNLYGLGFGARGGYTLGFGLYIGARFDYFLGNSTESFGTTYTNSIWGFQGELGYDIGLLDFMVLRPKLGFGAMQVLAKLCVTDGFQFLNDRCTSTSLTGAVFSMGAELPIRLGSVFTLSPEARINLWLGEGDGTAFHTGLIIGATF